MFACNFYFVSFDDGSQLQIKNLQHYIALPFYINPWKIIKWRRIFCKILRRTLVANLWMKSKYFKYQLSRHNFLKIPTYYSTKRTIKMPYYCHSFFASQGHINYMIERLRCLFETLCLQPEGFLTVRRLNIAWWARAGKV